MPDGERLILGIETSCDETAAAVVAHRPEAERPFAVRSNVVATQHHLHERYAGVVPELASRAHLERVLPVVVEALAQARCAWSDLAAVAVANRPGLIGSLLVGVSAAKAIAWSLRVPLLGADHVEAHLTAALLDTAPPPLPALGLVVSGGHTLLCRIDVGDRITLLGRTIDDAVGEAYDKVGALLGLPYPGGPAVDRLARAGDERAFELPLGLPRRDSLDFSFSGLKTAVLYHVRPPERRPAGRTDVGGAEPKEDSAPPALDDRRRADLAASFQRAAIGAVMRKVELALDSHSAAQRPASDRLRAARDGAAADGEDPSALGAPAPRNGPFRSLIVGGGVSANSRLRTALAALAEERGLGLRLPSMPYCVDNGAMIAAAGALRLARGEADRLSLEVAATARRTRRAP
ncbi:MAG TPA: tRNA (adenosine(37)-N6)-threonylcarbamoyltransferase complex transferase subunit TsaD [Phycisphaerales bacterium]|nr:tRNA (adenosine(37)-N6)-threonylcarbamoyltransferase complex transferase subunit TsaD [Phycisphaerales bacterium]HMP36568.1 tRNA (adenosine(37)-N6)-threonylcarbamoyltransferase complex transferase subunit TsaD [Phycisphaerales bacterium]